MRPTRGSSPSITFTRFRLVAQTFLRTSKLPTWRATSPSPQGVSATAYPRFVRSRNVVKKRRTSGNLTLNSVSWANVDTGLDLVLNEVQVGDELVYGIQAHVGTEAVWAYFDVVTVVGGSPVNSLGSRAAVVASPGPLGVSGWMARTGTQEMPNGTTAPYTVAAGDLTSGSITLRLRYATASAVNKTLYADATIPLDVWAMNLGPGA